MLAEINADRAVFYLEEVGIDEKTVEQHFSKKHIYYAGANESCSCGLLCQPEEDAEGKAPAKALLQCLDRMLQNRADVELYTCWVGNQFKRPQEHIRVSPSDFDVDVDGFDLEEEVFLTFVRQS